MVYKIYKHYKCIQMQLLETCNFNFILCGTDRPHPFAVHASDATQLAFTHGAHFGWKANFSYFPEMIMFLGVLFLLFLFFVLCIINGMYDVLAFLVHRCSYYNCSVKQNMNQLK